jgi:hypothetical protein
MPKLKPIEQSNSGNGNGRTKMQRFEYREIPRSQINPAPYNPRSISEYARKQLAKSLERFGLVEPLVWNETTGNLVSGHQRLEIIDREQGWPGCLEFSIGVSAVKINEKREKQLNVWLNNRAAQGAFDETGLYELLKESESSLDDVGLTRGDLVLEFGGLPGDLDSMFQPEIDASKPAVDGIALIKDRKKKYRAEIARGPEQDADYYLMVVFDSANAKNDWLRRNKFPTDARFVTANEFMAVTA